MNRDGLPVETPQRYIVANEICGLPEARRVYTRVSERIRQNLLNEFVEQLKSTGNRERDIEMLYKFLDNKPEFTGDFGEKQEMGIKFLEDFVHLYQ